MSDVAIFDDDEQPPLPPGGRHRSRKQRHNDPTSKRNSKRDQDTVAHQVERSRLDPPEGSCPQNPSTPRKSKSSARKQPDRRANMLPLPRGRKTSEAEPDPPTPREQHRPRRERRHERRGGRPTARGRRAHRGGTSREESLRARSPRRRGHPALSSSFQVRPHQLLQVYEDLREKHREPKRSEGKDGGADEVVSRGDGGTSGRDLESKLRAGFSGSFSCESSSEHEESVDGGGGTNCLVAVRDEKESRPQDGGFNSNIDAAKATPRNVLQKDGFARASICRKGSIGTATTATASELTAALTKGLDDHGSIIPTDRSYNRGDCHAIAATVVNAAATASSSKTRRESRDLGSIEDRSTTGSHGHEPTLTLTKEPPTLPPPIDSQLLQKQINYLQNEPATASRKRTDRQLIIYCSKEPPTLPPSIGNPLMQRQIKYLQNEPAPTSPKSTKQRVIVSRRRRPPTTQLEASIGEIRRETQRRREISHRRGSTRKSDAMMFCDRKRRSSFS